MLAFRKWFLALAVVALTVAVASAQQAPAFQCVANAGVPPIVRAEGIAELVGDLVLNCNNGAPAGSLAGQGAIPQVNVQIFLNTNITSRIDGSDNSEALLMIDEPTAAEQQVCMAPGPCLVAPLPAYPGGVYKPYNVGESTVRPYNVFQGRRASANSVVWFGVPIDAPGTTVTRIIRITNVRANANQLGVSSTLVPTQIVAFISATGTTSVPINNPQQTVAWIQQGMTFSVREQDGDSGAETKAQCSSNYGDLFTDPTKTDYGCFTGRLRFQEGFASSFKARFDVTNLSAGTNPALIGNNQNNPGSIYNASESGFWTASTASTTGWPSVSGYPAGQANQGTRLRVVFNNVPAGVRIYVSIRNIAASGAKVGWARLVNVAADGSGSYAETPNSGSATTCSAWSGAALEKIAEMPIFGGSGNATWEVMYDANSVPGDSGQAALSIQRYEFGYIAAYKANTSNNLPGLGTATANGMFAPVSTVTTASTVAPVPRFADTSSALNLFTINACVTNLLFPFVTNQVGFDTGLVISNTSKDPWGHSTQAGTCEINYYGDTNGAVPPPAQTSGVIPAGDYAAWTLSGGGKFGLTATPGFQGYIIARCKFRFAHGFAYISDAGAQKLAHGYLALIMDVPMNRDDVGTSENLGQ